MNKIRRFAEEKKGISLMELAEKIGISNIRMLKIANEETPLRPIETLNLLIYFDCKPSELFGNAFEGFFDE